jgi:hypothetical protein
MFKRSIPVLTLVLSSATLVHCSDDAETPATEEDSGADTGAVEDTAVDSTTADTAFDSAVEDTTVDTSMTDTTVADTGSDTTIADTGSDTTIVDASVEAEAGSPLVVINEVESSGGTPGDWIELYNAGSVAADVSGWKLKDNDDAHAFYVLPSGTTIAAGGFLVIEEADLGFGLGAADSARLFLPDGTTLASSYDWTAHATTTYGRCPDGTGAFTTTTASTKGAANACGSSDAGTDGGTAKAWPGVDTTTIVDGASVFGGNLSGLFYEAGASAATSIMWGVRNNPSMLHRLLWDGSKWAPDTTASWSAGKTLRFKAGTGSPDAEDVTKADLASSTIYVGIERDNDVATVSKQMVLSFDTATAGATLDAKMEWDLTADLPVVGANFGIEAITFLPDAYLTSKSFHDDRLGKTYAPADYANHGGGLFMVGIEATGGLYVYALDHVAGTAQRVAMVSSGFPGVMAVSLDRDLGGLFAWCDDLCGNKLHILEIDTTTGKFVLRAEYAKPTTLPNLANEGMTFAPESQCTSGQKSIFWADDGETGGHAIRRDTIPCGHFW